MEEGGGKKVIRWKDLETIVLRVTGKWVLGAVVQENEEGKRRLKLFKGRIKEDGNREIEYKGKKLRISMIQRFNIPSRKYWYKLNREILKIFSKYFREEQKSLIEF